MWLNVNFEFNFRPFCNSSSKILRKWPHINKFPSFQVKRVPLSECYTRFLKKQRFFSAQPRCYLTFLWIELEMLLRCCLIHKSIILRHILYLLYLRPYLDLSLYMSYLCDLIFIFTFIFIMINHIISWIQSYMFFCLVFRICPIIFGW